MSKMRAKREEGKEEEEGEERRNVSERAESEGDQGVTRKRQRLTALQCQRRRDFGNLGTILR